MNLIAKYRALVALAMTALVVTTACHPSRDAAVKEAIETAAKVGPKPFFTQAELHKFGATGDNPAGWKIDPTSGNLVAPTGKMLEGLSQKQTVLATATTNVATMSGLAQTVDTVALSAANKRVLLTNQTTGTQTGCWVTASGAWTRCPDLATGASAAGAFFVSGGSANKGIYLVTNASGSDVTNTATLTFQNLASGGGGGLTSPLSALLDFGSHPGTNVTDPTGAQDIATKNYVDGRSAASIQFFGDGSDGDLTISSGTTTLTRDTYYATVTITGTASIATAGYTLYVSTNLDISNAPANAITRSGGNGGAGATAGTGGTAGTGAVAANGNTCGGAQPGIVGGAGGTAAGTQGGAATAQSFTEGGDSNNSGAGGLGASGAGGLTRAGAVGTVRRTNRQAFWELSAGIASATQGYLATSGGMGGPGGSGGGGDGTAGGGGGGGGGGAGILRIYARTVTRSGSTAASAISARGGVGGDGGAATGGNRGGGGAGPGGGGGGIHFVIGTLAGTASTNTVDASGGNGGTGGAGFGTGVGGNGGSGGNSGFVGVFVLSTGAITTAGGNLVAVAGSAASGTTGGALGTGAFARVSL